MLYYIWLLYLDDAQYRKNPSVYEILKYQTRNLFESGH